MAQYGIENVLEGDSSEDEDNPKKQIPSWASSKLYKNHFHRRIFILRYVYSVFFQKKIASSLSMFKVGWTKKKLFIRGSIIKLWNIRNLKNYSQLKWNLVLGHPVHFGTREYVLTNLSHFYKIVRTFFYIFFPVNSSIFFSINIRSYY